MANQLAVNGVDANTGALGPDHMTPILNGNQTVLAQMADNSYLEKPFLLPVERGPNHAALVALPAPQNLDGYVPCGPVKAAFVYQVQSIPANGTVPAWSIPRACRFAIMRELMFGSVGGSDALMRRLQAANVVGELNLKAEETFNTFTEVIAGHDASLGDGVAYNFAANNQLPGDNSARYNQYRTEIQAILSHASFRKAKRVVISTLVMNGCCFVTGRHHLDRTSSFYKDYKRAVMAKDYDVDLLTGVADKEDIMGHKVAHPLREVVLMNIAVDQRAKLTLQTVKYLTLADRLPPKVPNSGAIYTGHAMMEAFGPSVVMCLTLPVLNADGEVLKTKVVKADGSVEEEVVRHFTTGEAQAIVDRIKKWFKVNKDILDQNIIRYSAEPGLQTILEAVTSKAAKILAFSVGLAEGAKLSHSTVDETAYRAGKAKSESPAAFLSGLQLGKRLKTAPVDASTIMGIFTEETEVLPGIVINGANTAGYMASPYTSPVGVTPFNAVTLHVT
jgi:hypothetical protein